MFIKISIQYLKCHHNCVKIKSSTEAEVIVHFVIIDVTIITYKYQQRASNEKVHIVWLWEFWNRKHLVNISMQDISIQDDFNIIENIFFARLT